MHKSPGSPRWLRFSPPETDLLFMRSHLPAAGLRALILVLAFSLLASAEEGAEATYVGGTAAGIEGKSGRIITTDESFLEFRCKGKEVFVGYDKINLIEYGQNVDR